MRWRQIVPSHPSCDRLFTAGSAHPADACPKLIYLHGFNSSPQSTKARELMARVADLPAHVRPDLHVPELPHRPAQAMALVTRLIDQIGSGDLTLIGSSLGGYYATYLAERYAAANVRAVLINPTTGPAADLRPYFGPQRNLYTGEPYELTEEHLREFLALKVDTADPAGTLLPAGADRRRTARLPSGRRALRRRVPAHPGRGRPCVRKFRTAHRFDTTICPRSARAGNGTGRFQRR